MAALPPDTRTAGTPDPAGDNNALVDCVSVITGAAPGGTVTAQQTMDTLAGGVAAGQYLRGNGTHAVMSAIQAGDVPALSYAAMLTPTGTKTANYTASPGDFVPCDTATTGAFTVTLPTPAAAFTTIAVKMIKQASTNAVTIAAAGGDVFNVAGGGTSLTLALLNQGVILQYRLSGAIWYVLSDDLPLGGLDTRYVLTSALPLALASGGTGQATQQAAMDALAGAVTSGLVLRGNGTHVTLAAIQAADVPTLNQNTTGTASNVTGTVALGNGGTGQITQQAALDTIAGAVTNNRVLAGNGTHVTLRALAAADVPSLDALTAPAANVSLNSHKITGLSNGTAATDAAAFGQITSLGTVWQPGDDGFLGANSDPGYASGGGLAVDQTLYLQRITPRVASTVTNLWYCLSTLGSDTGTGVFFVGLWDSGGNLLSGSANLVSSTTATAGYKAFALTTPQSVTAGSIYYAGLLAHLTTTQPTFLRQNNSTNAAPQASVNIATARWSAKTSFGTALGNATLSGFAQTAFTFIALWS